MVELLAPAGDCNAGYAALEYGADAVYLGLNKFSARAEAVNFTPHQLKIFTNWAHEHGKHVLVAVNTLIFDDEIPDLIDTLQIIDDVKADGVIVQDLGVAKIIKTYFPNLALHASTQMAVHNKEGAEALRRFGFKRVVLARELTLNEIRDICKNVDIEIEVFIHGALCYSYSGLCLFSAIYTGRSANRGKCVYPCRESFKTNDGTGFCFSMKDFALNEEIRKLADAGVTALKIEGRKKSALYTGAVSDFYRTVLNNDADKKTLKEKHDALKTIFSRPYTDFYIHDKKNADIVDVRFVGHRGLHIGTCTDVYKKKNVRFISFKTGHDFMRYDGIQLDIQGSERPFGFSAETIFVNNKTVFQVSAGQTVGIALPPDAPFVEKGVPVYLASSAKVKKSYPYTLPRENDYLPKTPVHVFVSLAPKGIRAKIENIDVFVSADLSVAKKPDLVTKSVNDAFLKTDKSGFSVASLTCDNPQNLFAPASLLNETRRLLYEKALETFTNEATKQKDSLKSDILAKETFSPSLKKVPFSYIIKTDDVEKLTALTTTDFEKIDEIQIELNSKTKIGDFLPKDKIRLCLPVISRDWETDFYKRQINSFIAEGYKKWEIGNMWGFSVLPVHQLDVTGDWYLYVANLLSAQHLFDLGLKRVTVSPETPDASKLFNVFPDKTVAMIYEDLPLFISETCHKKTLAGKCVHCSGNFNEKAENRYGSFEFSARQCRLRVLGEHPRIKKNEAVKAGARLLRMDFTYRNVTSQNVAQTVRRLIS